jgi:hypothetical protein
MATGEKGELRAPWRSERVKRSNPVPAGMPDLAGPASLTIYIGVGRAPFTMCPAGLGQPNFFVVPSVTEGQA